MVMNDHGHRYDEDKGFAINGGKGFSKVVFNNHAIDLNGPLAVAMGTYVFTCATTGEESTVEYTFGYKKNKDGKEITRIFFLEGDAASACGKGKGQAVIAKGKLAKNLGAELKRAQSSDLVAEAMQGADE